MCGYVWVDAPMIRFKVCMKVCRSVSMTVDEENINVSMYVYENVVGKTNRYCSQMSEFNIVVA